MFSLSVVILASVLASVALFFLMRSSLAEHSKQKILVIMGVLIFFSIAISNFKSRELSLPFLTNSTHNKLSAIFLKDLPPYPNKYTLDQEVVGDTLGIKNYGKFERDKEFIEWLVFISNKGDGASYYLYQMAGELRSKKIPTLYVKLQSHTSSNKQFFRKSGLTSFQSLRFALSYYLEHGIRPYLIIDNAELVPFQVLDIIDSFETNNSPHMILNTEDVHSFVELISDNEDFLRRIQFQKWMPPDNELLEKLSPTNSYVKKLPINFETINYLSQGLSEEQILLKGSNAQKNVAAYFGMSSYYDKIRRLMEKGPVTMGVLQENEIPIQVIEKFERLKLLSFQNGEAILG